MNKKEYTREYLRDNFEFPERIKQEKEVLILDETSNRWLLGTDYKQVKDGNIEITYKLFKGFDY